MEIEHGVYNLNTGTLRWKEQGTAEFHVPEANRISKEIDMVAEIVAVAPDIPGVNSPWLMCNILEEGGKFTKHGGTGKPYDAVAIYCCAKSICFSAGQTNAYIRVGFTSDGLDDENFRQGFYVGLYPGGELKIPGGKGGAYTCEDQFHFAMEGPGAVLYKGEEKMHSWEQVPNSDQDMHLKFFLNGGSPSMKVFDVIKNQPQNSSATPMVLLGSCAYKGLTFEVGRNEAMHTKGRPDKSDPNSATGRYQASALFQMNQVGPVQPAEHRRCAQQSD